MKVHKLDKNKIAIFRGRSRKLIDLNEFIEICSILKNNLEL